MTTGVVELLVAMRGVWLDHLQAFHPDGTPMVDDPNGGTPGPFPYDNLVYLDVDPETGTYAQTNVTFRGRPVAHRSFTGKVGGDGVLRFDHLGPSDPGHVGVSGGPGVLWFVADTITHPGLARYAEPDHIRLLGAGQRTRVTVLYREGILVRTMTVAGSLLTNDPTVRHPLDPRGRDGPVHEARSLTHVYESAGPEAD